MFDPFSLDDSDVSAAPDVRLSLRIRGDALDPDFLTQQLGVAPTSSSRRDDNGDGTGEWSYDLTLPPATDLGDAIDQILALFPQDATLWEELASSYTIDVLCQLSLEGKVQHTSLGAEVIQRLARLGMPLTLELRRQ